MSFLLKKVQESIERNTQLFEKQKFLLAVSGGIDSMVVLDIFNKLNLSFEVAHVNFQLRGEESNQDELFVIEQCKKYSLEASKIHIQRFDTIKEHEKTKDTSIQMLARKLRYQWFFTLMQEHKIDYLVTAHHADDNIETFFVKLFRKSPQGIAGMDELSSNGILRPLLNVFRNEIQEYALENSILYREDSSNLKEDYLRNHIRHYLVPFIENHYPQAKNAILDTMKYQKDLNTLAYAYVSEIWQKVVSQYDECHIIDLTTLYKYPQNIQDVLPWHFAEGLGIGMKQFDQFKHLFDPKTSTGKEMVTQTHKAVRYKQSIQVFPLNKHAVEETIRCYYTNTNQAVLSEIPRENILIYSDTFKLNEIKYFFEGIVKIRKWCPGDRIFHKGKYKLIADLIPEYEITPYQKEYLYCAITTYTKNAEKHPIFNPDGSKLEFSIEIMFVFYCPNSILLQLK